MEQLDRESFLPRLNYAKLSELKSNYVSLLRQALKQANTRNVIDLVSNSMNLEPLVEGNLLRTYADMITDRDEMAAGYQRLIAAYPEDHDILYGRLLARMDQKDYETCAQLLEQGLLFAEIPDYGYILNRLLL